MKEKLLNPESPTLHPHTGKAEAAPKVTVTLVTVCMFGHQSCQIQNALSINAFLRPGIDRLFGSSSQQKAILLFTFALVV